MPALSRIKILEANDALIEKVPTPEWGGADDFVCVKSLRASQRPEIAGLAEQQLFYALLILTLCDEDGTSLGFTEVDIEVLKNKSLAAMVRVFAAAMDINGMSKKAMDDVKGNSKPSPSEGSTTN